MVSTKRERQTKDVKVLGVVLCQESLRKYDI